MNEKRPQAQDGGNRIILSADHVSKTYRFGAVDVPVLRGASLDIREGEWVSVLGASGSGKSTLLHILAGYDQPDPGAGRVLYAGHPLDEAGTRALNRYRNQCIGMVFQFYHLLPELTVVENVLLPTMIGRSRMQWRARKATYHARALELLEGFGLADRLAHRSRELSGGERQRVAIARSLINGPGVLLADEPTGNLDERSGDAILQLLEEQHAGGMTIVMVTHDPALARRTDRIVEILDGVVEAR